MKIQDRANVWSGEYADVHLKQTNVCKGIEMCRSVAVLRDPRPQMSKGP